MKRKEHNLAARAHGLFERAQCKPERLPEEILKA